MKSDNDLLSFNPFLKGNFAPVREEVTVAELKVTGVLPPDLAGMFVRNGPNPQFAPIKNYHWFEGDGMLHGVLIRDGRASYRNRYIRTRGWQSENACGKTVYGSFLDPIDARLVARNSWNRLRGRDLMKNTANTALVCHDRKLFALWEAGEPYEISVPELNTAGPYRYDGRLKHAFTAHPKIDPETGEMMFFGYNPFKPVVSYSIVNRAGELARTTTIKIRRPVMMHDFAVTTNYTIFLDLPFTFSLMRALRGQPALKFEPELGARIGVLPRHAGGKDIKWFAVSSGFVFHTLNAWEEQNEIVLLACRTNQFPESFFVPPDERVNGAEIIGREWQPVMYRWRINLDTGAVREAALDDLASEFPRVNEDLVGRTVRYGYTSTLMIGPNALLKYDYEKGESQTHIHGAKCIGGEGVFVSRPDAKTEDDGWLLTYIHNEETNQSELVIIEARDFAAPPVARIHIPVRVPYGFHGIWIPETMAQ